MSHAILAVFVALGAIDGRVVDFRTQQPIVNVAVRAVSPAADFATHTDAHGDFVLQNLPPGQYRLAFVHPLYFANGVAALTVSAGQNTHLQVALKREWYIIDGLRTVPVGWLIRPGVTADVYRLGGGMPIFAGPPNDFGPLMFVPGLLVGNGPRLMH